MNRMIELLIAMALIAALIVAIIIGQSGNQSNQNQQTGVYQCVKIYVVNDGSNKTNFEKVMEFVVPSSLPVVTHIDLRSQDGSLETMECNDDFWEGITDSDSRCYFQFESGKWYSITSIGIRQHGNVPNITEVHRVSDPPAEREL